MAIIPIGDGNKGFIVLVPDGQRRQSLPCDAGIAWTTRTRTATRK